MTNKFNIIISALLLITASVQCTKFEVSEKTETKDITAVDEKVYVTFSTSRSDTKATIEDDTALGLLKYKWEGTDKLHAFDGSKYCGELSLTSGEGTEEASFAGTLSITPGAKSLFFFYFGGSLTVPSTESTTVDFGVQDGTLSWLKDRIIASCTAPYSSGQTVFSGNMKVAFAIGKFSFSSEDFNEGDKIKVKGLMQKVTISEKGIISFVAPSGDICSEVTYTSEADHYIAMPSDESSTITFYNQAVTKDKAFSKVISNGIYYRSSTGGLAIDVELEDMGTYTMSTNKSSLTFDNGKTASSAQTIDVTCQYTEKGGSPVASPWIIKSYKIGESGEEVTVSGSTFTAGGITATVDGTNSQLSVTAAARKNSGAGSHDNWTAGSLSGITDLSTLDFRDDFKTSHSMTTANCYIICQAGTYKLPLVYGNAVKNGAKNETAYKNSSSAAGILQNFLAHDDSAIESPFIEDKEKAVTAEVVWQDQAIVVKDLSITGTYQSSGNTTSTVRYLQFTVDPSTVCQNNAVIAVKDGSGKIIWSWHIWITNASSIDDPIAVTSSGSVYSWLGSGNMGELDDLVYNSLDDVIITLCAQNNSSVTQTVTMHQPSSTEKATVYYQWGRKDPLPYAEALYSGSVSTAAQGAVSIPTSILNPSTLYPNFGKAWASTSYSNLWGEISTANNVKTIYDPSPVGYKVPVQGAFNVFKDILNWSDTEHGHTFTADTGTIFFHASGYIKNGTSTAGNRGDMNTSGHYWTANRYTNSLEQSNCFYISSIQAKCFQPNEQSYAFSVRPVTE